jgi:drug/metabolite transporter superfamily protein YnfA
LGGRGERGWGGRLECGMEEGAWTLDQRFYRIFFKYGSIFVVLSIILALVRGKNVNLNMDKSIPNMKVCAIGF